MRAGRFAMDSWVAVKCLVPRDLEQIVVKRKGATRATLEAVKVGNASWGVSLCFLLVHGFLLACSMLPSRLPAHVQPRLL